MTPNAAVAAGAIAEHAAQLAGLASGRSCAGRWWLERYGERGRQHIVSDSVHHVEHLVAAMELGTADAMAGYARWLQSVLINRGMCSAHIEEHFRDLHAAIAGVLGDEVAAAAAPFIDAAAGGLRPAPPEAAYLHDHAAEVLDRATRRIEEVHPAWSRWEGTRYPGIARLRRDLQFLLSYLADSLGSGHPDTLYRYIAWMEEYFARRGRPGQYLAELIVAVRDALASMPAREARAGQAMLTF